MFAIGWLAKRLALMAAAALLVAAPAGPGHAQAPMPDEARTEYMIKNTLAALNHANLTGNYTVLRDLGSPRFRANNDAARLASVFAPMREEGLDLAPIMVFSPQLGGPVSFDENGRLRVVGQFPTRPLRVVFELAYEAVGERWMIADISVNAVPWPDEGNDGQGERAPPQAVKPRAKPDQ